MNTVFYGGKNVVHEVNHSVESVNGEILDGMMTIYPTQKGTEEMVVKVLDKKIMEEFVILIYRDTDGRFMCMPNKHIKMPDSIV